MVAPSMKRCGSKAYACASVVCGLRVASTATRETRLYRRLESEGVAFVSAPLRFSGEGEWHVQFNEPGTGKRAEHQFDWVAEDDKAKRMELP